MKKATASSYILIAAALWGCIAVFYRGLSALGFSALQVVFLRTATAALMTGVYLSVCRRSEFRIRLRDLWMFIGTGIVSLAFFNVCYFRAMDEISPSVAAVLLYTAPIFVIFLSAVLFRERLTAIKLIGTAIAFVGCILVTGALTGASVTGKGLFFGLGSGIGYALYTIFGVYALRRYDSWCISFYTFVLRQFAYSFCVMQALWCKRFVRNRYRPYYTPLASASLPVYSRTYFIQKGYLTLRPDAPPSWLL